MAINIITQPAPYHAAYNPSIFVLDSTNKNQEGFRYIVEVYDWITSDRIFLSEVAPDPFMSGQCQVNLNHIIKNKVDTFFDLNNFQTQDADTTYWKYNVRFGESYSSEWVFADYIFTTGFTAGNTALTTDSGIIPGASDIPHNYVVGSQLFIDLGQTYGDNRDLLNGYFTVIGVISPYTVAINVSGIGAGPETSGTTIFADFTKVKNYALTGSTGLTTVNVAQSVDEYADFSGNLQGFFLSSGTTNSFLTNMPDTFYVTENQFLYENMLMTLSTSNIRFENDGGDIFAKSTSGGDIVKATGVGPANLGTLSTISGSTPLIKDDTKYYEYYMVNITGQITSERKRVMIDRRCTINDHQILFMDRKGSYKSFAFQLLSEETIETKKEQYKKAIYNYETSAKGDTTYYSTIKKKMKLNSNFLNEDANYYFEELLSSPYTYINYNNRWYSVTIPSSSYVTESFKRKKLIRRAIEVTFDLNSPVNI